jgi:competence protein ComEA
MAWHRFTEQLREYFTFTRKERNGILVLLILLIIMQGAIVFTHYYKPPKEVADISAFQKEVLAFQQSMQEKDSTMPYGGATKETTVAEITLFPFNPNVIDEAQWKSLGVNERTVHSIKNYLSKGGHFYKKEDLKKIYNLRPEEYLRLEPYIAIEDKNKSEKSDKEFVKQPREVVLVEINGASKEDLMKLPMVGEKRAEQIIKYRDRLGGFVKKEQLKEVYSIPDSIYQMILPGIALNAGLIKPIKLNSISSDTIYHPYLKKNLLKMILNYRNQHGAFTDKLVLKKLPLMTDSVYAKLEPYFSLD